MGQRVACCVFLLGTFACSGSDSGDTGGRLAPGGAGGGGAASGGSGGTESGSGGTSGSGNGGASGGTNASGGIANGGTNSNGGSANGGTNATGGTNASGGAGTGGATGGSAGAAGSGSVHPCRNPTVRRVSDGPDQSPEDTGFDDCEGGGIRRRKAMRCPLGPTAAQSPCTAPTGCTSDADCTQSPHGICANAHNLLGYCGCFYGCMQDSDCDPGRICLCGDPAGVCIPATCVDDSVCPAGAACASSSSTCYGGTSAFVCQDPADECLNDADCGTGKRCVLQASSRRTCVDACLPTP